MKKLLFTALVVAVFGFYFFSEAAADCDPFDPDCFFWFFFCPECTMDSTTGSSVDCKFASGAGTVTINKTAATAGTFAETGNAVCTSKPDGANLGPCDFEFSISPVTLNGCEATGSCEATASCVGTDPTVTGKLTCADRVLFFGLSRMNDNQCTSFFPELAGLAAGQLLHASFTKDANGLYQTIGTTTVRGCNSDVPDVDCSPPGGVNRPSQGTSPSGVPFELDFVQTVNTSPNFCKKVSIDKGQATFHVFGSGTFSPANMDVPSVQCNGQGGVTCGNTDSDLNNDGFLDRKCQIPTCPFLGPNLGQLVKNDDGTVTATCTGKLLETGQGIVGLDDVNTSPK